MSLFSLFMIKLVICYETNTETAHPIGSQICQKNGLLEEGGVCYHVDQCTMNKRMIQIPKCGLFLTCTESSFLLCTHNIRLRASVYLLNRKKEVPLLGMVHGGPLFMVANSHPLRSLAWSQLPLRPLGIPHPPHLLPAKMDICLQTDDINMPAASVGHRWILKLVTCHPVQNWISKLVIQGKLQ